jgi:hypothetical protein
MNVPHLHLDDRDGFTRVYQECSGIVRVRLRMINGLLVVGSALRT